MNHQGTKTILTSRLILRRFRSEDADAAYRNWCSSDQVTRFLTWPTHLNVNVTRSVIDDWVTSYQDPRSYQWAIELQELCEPIGSISVVNVDDDVDAIEIGYCLGQPWWHRGIMTEALAAVTNYFFDEVGANRVCAKHDADNPRSGAVMKACGLTYEGTLRQAHRNNQGIVDTCVYSILRTEWQGLI